MDKQPRVLFNWNGRSPSQVRKGQTFRCEMVHIYSQLTWNLVQLIFKWA